MMSVLEYANDINKSVEDVIKECRKLGIKATDENYELSDDEIIMLDNSMPNEPEESYDDEELDTAVENIISKTNIKVDDTIKSQKLSKKKDIISNKDKEELNNRKKAMYKNKDKLMGNKAKEENVILYKENMTVSDFASALNVNTTEIIKKLMMLGLMLGLNNPIDFENASLVAMEYGKELKREETTDVSNFEEFEAIDDPKDLIKRPPVVTIMGHVDHGKTTLLDTIRKTHVAAQEAGGITQAIGAYQIEYNGSKITFIDTPGHEAFTEMRARGASVTDIVVIIVAADDGVMPQTREAIDHAKAAGVPIIVAVNKMDKPGATADRVMTEMVECGLTPDEWGGDTLFIKISAKTGMGVDQLLENILLIAEMNDYKANPSRYALGTVIESKADKNIGNIVSLLIGNGTLRLGDPIVVGTSYGKVRTMKNDLGQEIVEAYPSQPVEITGLNTIPSAGDKFMAFETEKQARIVEEQRKLAFETKNNKQQKLNFEDLFAQIQEGVKEINIILKADVKGSEEAVKNSLSKIDVEGVKVKIIRSGTGSITESDVVLANASNAIIIGFNIKPTTKTKDIAKQYGVEIRFYDIIYKVTEEIEDAMKGMLEPIYEEITLGQAEIRKIYKFSKVGNIAGSYVTEGVIKRDAKARIIRDGVVIYDGKIGSVQREKDSVKEVKAGLECGITIENYNDIKEKDIIEAYEVKEMKR
mgnify:FL=1